jgi:DNA replication protein DnaC
MTAANQAPELLLQHHLKKLRLPTVLRDYEKLARQCAAENVDHVRYLARLIELELIDREARMVDRRINLSRYASIPLPVSEVARFPAIKSLETFGFDAIPTLNKKLVLDLARSEFVDRRENIIALGPSGVGKTHIAIGLGLAACQHGIKTRFATAAAIVHELIEARDETRLCLAAPADLRERGRVGLRSTFQDRRRVTVRTGQPALRARRHHHHLEPAV